ncbi:glycosyltransferase [Glutamicibacter sp.]|uniref:glycosyltransferase n=1 Tax=Glutamicibacter sp. TaxID=1931995 RepID=UPI0028BE8CBB|nr:glycosyltransferase [Glutamicibacter sp.]
MKRKILFFTTGMTVGGAERVIATLADRLHSRGYQIVITMLKGEESEYPLADGIIVHSARLEAGARNFPRALRFYRRIVALERPDVVISFSTKSNLLSLLSKRVFKTRVPLIVSERSDPHTRDNKMQRACNFFYRFADSVVCQGKKVASYYEHHLNGTQVLIVSNPLNEESTGAVTGTERDPVIVSVGRLSREKNHKLGIEVFSKLQVERSDLRMRIYGAGPLQKELESQIAEMGLIGRVTLEGVVPNVLCSNENAAIFLFTSNHEGFPNALLEAAATGIPSVTTDFSPGTAHEIIKDGVNGFIVPAGDGDALITACRKALDGEIDQNDLEVASRRIREVHDVEQIADSWIRAVDDVLVN